MRFDFGYPGSFEITGIKKVVVNEIRMNGKVKEKVGKTFVWELAHVGKGARWLKYEWGVIAAIEGAKMSKEESSEFAKKAILDGASPLEIHDSIMNTMHQKAARVWFSGETCNVEITLVKIEEQEKERREALRALLEEATHLVHRAERKVMRAKRIAGKSRGRGK